MAKLLRCWIPVAKSVKRYIQIREFFIGAVVMLVAYNCLYADNMERY